MLDSLEINGFKPWDKMGPIRLAPISAFFGANSSGKTSILQFLLMLKQTVASKDPLQTLNFSDIVDLGTMQDVLHKAEDGQPLSEKISWQISWKLEKSLALKIELPTGPISRSGKSIQFRAVVKKSKAGNPEVESFFYIFDGQEFSFHPSAEKGTQLRSSGAWNFELISNRGRPYPLPAPFKCYGFPDRTRTQYQNTAFLKDFEASFESLFDKVFYLGPLREDPKRQYTWGGGDRTDVGPRGEYTVEALLAGQHRPDIASNRTDLTPSPRNKRHSLQERVAGWLRELGLIYSFEVEPISDDTNLYRVRVKNNKKSSTVLLTEIGFGISQVLPVLTILFYVPDNSIVILEQPELHLHPAVQASLADVLIDAAKSKNIQIILESHSEHLLHRFLRRIAERKIEDSDVAFFFLRRDGGHSVIDELQVDLFGNVKNWPKDFFGNTMTDIAERQKAMLRKKASL